MAQDWVCLAHLWQNRGFMQMPQFILESLLYAFKEGLLLTFKFPPNPPDQKRPLDLFGNKCLSYDNSEVTQQILKLAGDHNFPIYQSVWHPLTVNAIEANLNNYPKGQARIIQNNSLERVWRWKFWYPAFTFFWALIFHVENEWLRRPEFIWQELTELAETFIANESDNIKYYSESEFHYYLALYERILGIQSDTNKVLPHYKTNILERIELSKSEREERPALFQRTINHIRQRLEEKLLTYKS